MKLQLEMKCRNKQEIKDRKRTEIKRQRYETGIKSTQKQAMTQRGREGKLEKKKKRY